MTINISDNNPRISYTATSGQTVFTVPFVFFNDADLNVYINDTIKTITTDYTVTGGDGSTGSITLTSGATLNDVVVITRDVALERTTDFPSSGPFQVASLNTELDTIIAMIADMEDLAERGLRLSDSDTSASLVLADKDARKGTVLAFNATTGAVEVGPTIADTETIASIKADIATLADIEDGTDATDAIQTVAGISSNVTTVAGISSDVTTVAGNNANVTTVAGNNTNITTVAGISANVTTVAGISSDVTSVAGDATDIGTVATNIANVNTVAANDANITTVAGQTTNMQNITDNLTAVQNAATNATNAATSASNASTSESNAAASAASAAASFDAFDDRYLGAKSSDPSTDNDGDALDAGDQYFNTTDNELKVYNGSAWQSASVVGGTVTSLTTSSLDANGGTIDGTVIGGTTPAAGTFTTLTMDDSTVVFRMQESDVTDQSTMLRNLGGDFIISAMDSNGDPGFNRFIIDQATGDIKFSTTGGTGLHWDYADASLGIGTTTLDATLQVGALGSTGSNRGAVSIKTEASDATIGESAIYIEEQSGSEGYYLGVSSDGGMFFSNSGASTPTLFLGDDDNVGIGTSSPSGLMSFAKGSRTLDLKLEDSPATGDSGVQLRAGSGDYFGIAAGGGTGVGIVIDDSNNVGIGTSSPSTALDVTGTITSDGLTIDNNGSIIFNDPQATDTILIGTNDDDLVIRADAGDILLKTNNNSTSAVVDASGNVGIGNSSPDTNLEISDTSGAVLRLSGHTGGAINVTPYDIGSIEFKSDDASGDGPRVVATVKTEADTASTVPGGELVFETCGISSSGTLTERMRIDSSGNVGIGVTSPTYRIEAAATSGGNGIKITRGSDSFFQQFQGTTGGVSLAASGSGGYLALRTGTTAGTTTERMRIDSSGNVDLYQGNNLTWRYAAGSTIRGSITVDSADNIKLSNGSSNTERMRITSGGDIGVNTTSPSSDISGVATVVEIADNNCASIALNNTGASTKFEIASLASDALTFRDNGTERLRIDNSGRVLIGTDSGDAFNSDANLRLQAGGNNYVQIKTPSTNQAGLLMGDTDDDFAGGIIYNNSGDYLRFDSDNGERLRITGADFMFNDTTSNPLAVISATGGDAIGIKSTSGYVSIKRNESGAALYINKTDSANGDLIQFRANGVSKGDISTNGTTVSYNTTSDYRLKENVTDITDGIERVKQLNPSRFNFIADADITVDGFLAHEVSDIVPEAVSGEKDAMQDEEYEATPAIYEDVVIPAVLDDDGNEIEAERTEQQLVSKAVIETRSVPSYQSIDQAKLVPLLTAALQEAIAKIETLEAKVTALENA